MNKKTENLTFRFYRFTKATLQNFYLFQALLVYFFLSKLLQPEPGAEALFGINKLKVARSAIPAVTHVDYSARIQTVHKDTNPRFHQLLSEFDQATDCPVLVNTSFNVRGEPIVASPEDAYRCFMRTEMDYPVLENCLLEKSHPSDFPDAESWQDDFELD